MGFRVPRLKEYEDMDADIVTYRLKSRARTIIEMLLKFLGASPANIAAALKTWTDHIPVGEVGELRVFSECYEEDKNYVAITYWGPYSACEVLTFHAEMGDVESLVFGALDNLVHDGHLRKAVVLTKARDGTTKKHNGKLNCPHKDAYKNFWTHAIACCVTIAREEDEDEGDEDAQFKWPTQSYTKY
jgi:hypothetical protein